MSYIFEEGWIPIQYLCFIDVNHVNQVMLLHCESIAPIICFDCRQVWMFLFNTESDTSNHCTERVKTGHVPRCDGISCAIDLVDREGEVVGGYLDFGREVMVQSEFQILLTACLEGTQHVVPRFSWHGNLFSDLTIDSPCFHKHRVGESCDLADGLEDAF